ncbi:MAG: hypothetical protein KY394_05055 [Actinobacteria bacterium]|nr:hypothetical protein [Actinomycetota bacterium]
MTTGDDFVNPTEDLMDSEEEIEEQVDEHAAPDETDAGPLEHQVGAEDLTDPREEE